MTSFHVRHDFTPGVARETLLLLRIGSAIDKGDFIARARARDYEIGRRRSPDKVIASLRDLGLVERPLEHSHGMQLTPLGAQVADVGLRDELLFAELIHLRYSSLWTPEHGGEHFSWAYQTVCRYLWDAAPVPVDSDRLVATVLAAAERQFAVKSISFSSSSVLGVLHWLRALSPQCITSSKFAKRPACPPEAFMLTLEAIHASSGRSITVPIRLDNVTRDRVCRAALLDDAAFDEVLSQAEETMGLIRRSGDGGELVFLRQSVLPGLVA